MRIKPDGFQGSLDGKVIEDNHMQEIVNFYFILYWLALSIWINLSLIYLQRSILSKILFGFCPSVCPMTVCAYLWVWVCETTFKLQNCNTEKKSACLANNSNCSSKKKSSEKMCQKYKKVQQNHQHWEKWQSTEKKYSKLVITQETERKWEE